MKFAVFETVASAATCGRLFVVSVKLWPQAIKKKLKVNFVWPARSSIKLLPAT